MFISEYLSRKGIVKYRDDSIKIVINSFILFLYSTLSCSFLMFENLISLFCTF